MPTVTFEDYQALVEQIEGAGELKARLDALVSSTDDEKLIALQDSYFDTLRQVMWLTTTAPRLKSSLNEVYGNELGLVTDCATLTQVIVQHPVLGDPNLLGMFAALQDVNGANVSPELQSCNISASLTGEAKTMYDYYYGKYSNSGITVIPIAASGNEGRSFPYAPGYWPSVISVSGDYTDNTLQGCPLVYRGKIISDLIVPLRNPNAASGDAMALTEQDLNQDERVLVDKIYAELTNPRFNDAEVQMNGVKQIPNLEEHVLGCVSGTSFSAPRLSAEAAIYLLNGGTAQCVGDITSLPPLDHLPWNNLTRVEAANRFCANWNALVP
jgi:hypothetical protein